MPSGVADDAAPDADEALRDLTEAHRLTRADHFREHYEQDDRDRVEPVDEAVGHAGTERLGEVAVADQVLDAVADGAVREPGQEQAAGPAVDRAPLQPPNILILSGRHPRTTPDRTLFPYPTLSL